MIPAPRMEDTSHPQAADACKVKLHQFARDDHICDEIAALRHSDVEKHLRVLLAILIYFYFYAITCSLLGNSAPNSEETVIQKFVVKYKRLNLEKGRNKPTTNVQTIFVMTWLLSGMLCSQHRSHLRIFQTWCWTQSIWRSKGLAATTFTQLGVCVALRVREGGQDPLSRNICAPHTCALLVETHVTRRVRSAPSDTCVRVCVGRLGLWGCNPACTTCTAPARYAGETNCEIAKPLCLTFFCSPEGSSNFAEN